MPTGKQWLTAMLDDIPQLHHQRPLAGKGSRNSYKTWTGNDMRDADAMSAATPHCDVVTTDKYATAQLKKPQPSRSSAHSSSPGSSAAANASNARPPGRRPGRAFPASQATSPAAPAGGYDVLPRPRPSARRTFGVSSPAVPGSATYSYAQVTPCSR
jgi:hypothetical protein